MDRHRESIQKYLTELERAGFLKRQHLKDAGKFSSTRYELFEKPENDRRGKKPLRKFPTTEVSSTKRYQSKDTARAVFLPARRAAKKIAREIAEGNAADKTAEGMEL